MTHLHDINEHNLEIQMNAEEINEVDTKSMSPIISNKISIVNAEKADDLNYQADSNSRSVTNNNINRS